MAMLLLPVAFIVGECRADLLRAKWGGPAWAAASFLSVEQGLRLVSAHKDLCCSRLISPERAEKGGPASQVYSDVEARMKVKRRWAWLVAGLMLALLVFTMIAISIAAPGDEVHVKLDAWSISTET